MRYTHRIGACSERDGGYIFDEVEPVGRTAGLALQKLGDHARHSGPTGLGLISVVRSVLLDNIQALSEQAPQAVRASLRRTWPTVPRGV